MRALELAKVAAAAEALRVKRYARRQGIRVGLAGCAAIFVLALFAMLHVMAIVLLDMAIPLWAGVLVVLGVDTLAAGVLGMMAISNKPDRIELEAASLRRQSLAEARKAASSLATIGEFAGLAIGMTGRRRAKGSSLGKAWMVADLIGRFVGRR